MKLPHRVAVTGLGAICGLGHSLNEIWPSLLAGKSGISKVENIDLGDCPIQIAGEVKNFSIGSDLLEPKEAGRFDKFNHYALHATKEALAQAGLKEQTHYPASRIGAILGVGMGGFPVIESTHKDFMAKGARRVSPFFIPSVIPNMASGLISIVFGVKGVNYTIASACASSAHALGVAALEIMLGNHDVMITGGAEAVLSNLPFASFASMKALSKQTENPTLASRPFDSGRDGFVMGEGAGILILENFEKAKARGATIFAEVVGFGSSSDAHHITAPHPEGEGALSAITQALYSAELTPDKIDYINAHGTSTPLGDIAETKAIKKVFGEHAYKLNVSSTKSMTGHLLGAAGGLESIVCVKALHHQEIPPTINLVNPDPECDLNYTANTKVERKIEFALNNSFGFGGTNSSLIFKRYKE